MNVLLYNEKRKNGKLDIPPASPNNKIALAHRAVRTMQQRNGTVCHSIFARCNTEPFQ